MYVQRFSSIFSRSDILFLAAFMIVFLTSCNQERGMQGQQRVNWDTIQDSTGRIGTVEGLSGPEAVRYDPEQDVYFVSNFNGGGNDRDANGFITKVNADGTIDSLRFMTGTDTSPLHAPRGMFITGDTLWTADVDGVHGFNRKTGEQISFVDFTSFEPGFLNDIAAGSDGMLYVTDTGKSRLYKISNGKPAIATDSLRFAPNGVTFDSSNNRLILAPWGGVQEFYAWNPADAKLNQVAALEGGGNFDGIEIINGVWLIASQVDSSLHAHGEEASGIVIKTPGRPADIGVDTKRLRVAVPYIALNRVDIWQLPVE